jgi:hypothetical protein
MRLLREDDEEILEEGIYNLSDVDLREANIDRGVKGVKLDRDHLIKLLREWIELSSHALPPYLLVLSRSFTMSENISAKIAALEKLEKRIETLEKIAPKTADAAKAKLEEAKADVQRTIEKTAAAPEEAAGGAARRETLEEVAAKPSELSGKILEVASTLATAGEEVAKQGSALHSAKAELVSKQIEAMLQELEKDEKNDQNKKDKIWLLQQFAGYDLDKDGCISASELKDVLERMGERLPDDAIVSLVRTVDHDHDLRITFEEFQTVFKLLPQAKIDAAAKAAKGETARSKEPKV